jgi:hypothetical protein
MQEETLKMNELSITASTLNQVINAYNRNKDYEKELYRQSLSIIQRMYDIPSESNEAMEHGKKYEKLLIENKFKDDRYETQKVCETKVTCEDTEINIRATLDVYDKESDEIIELKCPYIYSVNSNNANDYASRYYTQVQIQYLCSKASKARVGIYSNNEFFMCNHIPFDENFIKDNERVIMDFWETLERTYKNYTEGDTQTIIDINKHLEGANPLLKDRDLLEKIEAYWHISKKITEEESRRKQLKEEITRTMNEYGVSKCNTLPMITISKTVGSNRMDYSKYLKDKFSFTPSMLSEEEKAVYMKKAEDTWVFRLKQSN